jgi:tetratricopeptide (TPR) repeat protein
LNERWRLAERVDELAAQAQELIANGDVEGAKQLAVEAVATARAIPVEDSIKWDKLELAGRLCAAVDDLPTAFRLFDELRAGERADAYFNLARALDEKGELELAVRTWLAAFANEELTSRAAVFRGLKAATDLRSTAHPETLRRLVQTVLTVEEWWRPPVVAE